MGEGVEYADASCEDDESEDGGIFMADVKINGFVTFISLSLTDGKILFTYSIFFDEIADMSMIDYYEEGGEDGIGGDEEEAIVEEGLEIEGEGFEGGLILFDEVEGGYIGCECGEEHVDHEDEDHFCYYFVALFGVGVVVGIALGFADDGAEEGAEEGDHH